MVSLEVIDMDYGLCIMEFECNLMFFMGFGILVVVFVFKMVMYLLLFMGIMFGLGIFWLVGDLVYCYKEDEYKFYFMLVYVLSKIDMSLLVFFIGILLVVVMFEYMYILILFV